jgi:hypothetical protein
MIYLYIIGILAANLVCHVFLVRLFNTRRRDETKSNAFEILEILLLIPPLAALLTGFLVLIGLFLKNTKSDENE